MSTAGWIFLIVAWAVIFTLVAFCFGKIFTGTTRYED